MPLFRAIIARRKVSSLLLSILTIIITKGLMDLFIECLCSIINLNEKWNSVLATRPNLDLNDSTNLLNLYQKSLAYQVSIFPSLFFYSTIWTICYLLRYYPKKLQQVYMLFVFVLIILNIFVAGVCKYFLPNTSEHWGWLSSGRRGARFGLRCPFGSRTRRSGGRPEGPAQFGHNLGNAIDRKQRNTC